MYLKSLLAATALCSVMIAPAFAQSTPKMRDLLKAWQMDKPSASTQFVTKSVTEDRAVLENVVFKGDAKDQTRFGQLVIQRMPQTDPSASQARFSLVLQDGTSQEADGGKTTIAKIEASGLTQASLVPDVTNWLLPSALMDAKGAPAARSAHSSSFVGDIRVDGLAQQRKTKEGVEEVFKIGTLNVLGLNLDQDDWQFNQMDMLNLEFQQSEGSIKIAKVSLNDVKGQTLDGSKLEAAKPEEFDFSKVALGSMRIEDVAMDFEVSGDKDQPNKVLFTISQMELAGLTEKKIGKVGLAGMKATMGEAEKRFEMGLESFAIEDINVAYFSALAGAIAKQAPKGDVKSEGRTALQGFADLAMVSAAAAAPLPAASSTPSVKLKDLLPGGPLDGGIGGAKMANFTINYQGVAFRIDKINLTQERNSNGIITATRFDPMTMKLTIPDALLNQPNSPMAMFAPLISDGVELVIRYGATYEPTTDLVNFSDLGYELKGWAGVNVTMAMDGFSTFFRDQTVDAMAQTIAPSYKKGEKAKDGQAEKKADDMAEFKRLMALYQGVRILNGSMELRDQGGIAKAAGVFASMMAPPTKGATSRTAAQDAQAVAQVRQSWAEPLRQQAAKKNQTAVERQFLISLARWLEVGGVMVAIAKPPVPVDAPTFFDDSDLATRLGLSFSNQPAAKN